MGNATRVAVILVLILGVGVLAKFLDRNIDETPSGPEQMTGERQPLNRELDGSGTDSSRIDSSNSKMIAKAPENARLGGIEDSGERDSGFGSERPSSERPRGLGGTGSLAGSGGSGALPGEDWPEDNWRDSGGSSPVNYPGESVAMGDSDGENPNLGGSGPGEQDYTGGESSGDPSNPAGWDRAGSEESDDSTGSERPKTDVGFSEPPSVQPRIEPAAVSGPGDLSPGTAGTDLGKPSPSSARTPGYPKQYKVEDGDSLWSIASDHYDRGELFTLILKANPALGDGELLKVGAEITIPAPPAKKPATATAVAGETKPVRPPAQPPVPSGMVRYTIQDGDTLYGIAADRLGDPERFDEIKKANPGLDPRRLHVGKTIFIPKK